MSSHIVTTFIRKFLVSKEIFSVIENEILYNDKRGICFFKSEVIGKSHNIDR